MCNTFRNREQSLWIYSKIVPYITVKNKRNGNEHMMQCPFCDEANTSSKKNAMRGYYYIDSQSFYCFRCDKYASALELYEKLSGLPKSHILPEYMSYIRSNSNNSRGINFSNFYSVSGVVETNNSDGITIDFNQVPENLKHTLTNRGREYLNERKIFESKNLPSYAKFYSASYKSKYEIVVIPWYIEGRECYYQWRFLDSDVPFPKYGFPKGLTKKIYGIDMIDPSFPFIICTEGVFDSLWVKNGVAVGGKHLTELQRHILKTRFPKHKIVYAFDNDSAGVDAMLKQSSENGNSLVFYWKDKSNGCKDLNEFAVKENTNYFFDEENIKQCIMNPLQLKLKILKTQ